MSATLSPTFFADLRQVHGGLKPPPLSAAFLSDLKKAYDTLPVPSDDNLRILAGAFDKWREKTRDFVRSHLGQLAKDDPLICPISLFGTMGIGRLETVHTRTLAWLLDPMKNEEHGFGHKLLEALLRQLARPILFDRLQVKHVTSEHTLKGSAGQGRLDVLAEGEWEVAGQREPWVLVIEAKVDASEGNGQLDKYDEWLTRQRVGYRPYRVFLTPDGRSPETDDDKAPNARDNKWEPMSYLELVRIFRPVYDKLRDMPGFHFLRFYLAGVLQDVCGLPRHVSPDAPDPYAIAAYLKSTRKSPAEDTSHDATR